MALHKVFVYGTLKRGEPNHGWFEKEKTGYYKFLYEAKTIDKLPLIIATQYNIPFLLHSPGNGNNVRGEVYEVDDKVFAQLDILEDHPNYYIRTKYDVEKLDGENKGTVVPDVWIYTIKNFKPELLKRTFYESYSNSGDHGLRYVERYLRGDTKSHKTDILHEESTLDDLNSILMNND